MVTRQSSNTTAIEALLEAQKWALHLQIPDRHKVALMGLTISMNASTKKAWPSLQSLAKRIGVADTSIIEATIAELIDCGLLTPTKTDAKGIFRNGVVRLEVGLELTPDKNPLLSILLQEKALRLDVADLYPTARLVLHYIAKCWDFALQAAPVDYKRARNSLPWLTPRAWAKALVRLKELGFIENKYRGNQYSLPRYSLDGFISAYTPEGTSTTMLIPLRDEALSNQSPTDRQSAYTPEGTSTTMLIPLRDEASSSASPPEGISKNPPYMNARAELPKNLEEEKTDTDITSTTRSGSSEFAAALIRELAAELQPHESLGPIIQIEPTTGVGWDASWGIHWAEVYRRHREAGRRSPLGIVFTEIRFMAQTNAITLAGPAPNTWTEEPERPEPTYSELSPDEAHPEARNVWDAALGRIQVEVTRPNFETWLKDTVGMAQTSETFVVGCPNAFVAEMLDQRMYSLIARSVESVIGMEIELTFVVYSDGESSSGPETAGNRVTGPFSGADMTRDT